MFRRVVQTFAGFLFDRSVRSKLTDKFLDLTPPTGKLFLVPFVIASVTAIVKAVYLWSCASNEHLSAPPHVIRNHGVERTDAVLCDA